MFICLQSLIFLLGVEGRRKSVSYIVILFFLYFAELWCGSRARAVSIKAILQSFALKSNRVVELVLKRTEL